MALRTRLSVIGLFSAVLAPDFAAAQLPTEKTLAIIDRTFICPEDLPNDATRETANTLFIQLVMSTGEVTTAQLIEFRMRMLRSHSCIKTLKIISKKK